MKKEIDRDDFIKAAYFNRIKGIKQHDIAEMMGISNAGRIAEACVVVDFAFEIFDELYKRAQNRA